MENITDRRMFVGGSALAATSLVANFAGMNKAYASDDIAETVALLQDRADIEACQYRYALGIDSKDPELMASAFCELMDAKYYSGTEFQDKDALEFCTSCIDSFANNGIVTQHYMNMLSLEIDGDVAYGCTYLRATHIVEETGQLWVIGGHYDNTYNRTSDGWRIKLVTLDKVYLEGEDFFAR